MLKRVNSTYQGSATIEEVLSRVKTIKKLKIPWIVVIALGFIIQWIKDIFLFYLPSWFRTLRTVFFVLFYLATSIGFLIYRRRLIKLMPKETLARTKRVTRRVTILSVLVLFNIIIAAVLNQVANSALMYIVAAVIVALITVAIIFYMVYIVGKVDIFICCKRLRSSSNLRSSQSTEFPMQTEEKGFVSSVEAHE
jgi:amino acid transporter